MTIADKIDAWPPKPIWENYSMAIRDSYLATARYQEARAERAEAERDLALEVLRYAVDNPEFDSAKFDADARAVLAACGGEAE